MSIHFDREIYFDSVRHALFGGSMTDQQVQGQEAILLAWENDPQSDDLRWLANALAQTKHETANTMWSIEEYQGAKQPYGQIDPETGQAYYGRGLIQLTHRENYRKATVELVLEDGDDLEWNAERALDMRIASDVMFCGMAEGWFRPPNAWPKFFGPSTDDVYGSREIINGDKHIVPSWSGGISIGKLIEGYHQHFLAALVASSQTKKPFADTVKLELTIPEGVNITVIVNGVPLLQEEDGP